MMCTAVLYGVVAIIMATSFSKFCLVVGQAIAGLALGTGFSYKTNACGLRVVNINNVHGIAHHFTTIS